MTLALVKNVVANDEVRDDVVGVGRLELPASWSRTKRATNCATPRNSFIIIIRKLGLVKD